MSTQQPKSTWIGTARLAPLLLAGLLLLTGCKEVLYSDLTEVEANEMVALLDAGGIAAGRDRDKDGIYSLTVDAAQVPAAVNLLRTAGYPRQRYQTIGEVFAGQGLVGTPFEERARFMHALNEELARTIAEIDGIRSARVQVMIPAQDRYDENAKIATAAVAIMHEQGRDLAAIVPSVKTLVSHSVPDLAYDNVAVALFPVGAVGQPTAAGQTAVPATRAMGVVIPGLAVSPLLAVLAVLAILSAFLLVALFGRLRRGGDAP
jgi:type III secretion protein J